MRGWPPYQKAAHQLPEAVVREPQAGKGDDRGEDCADNGLYDKS
jgi:hypothetical protein